MTTFKEPSTIVNRSLDALGCGYAIGSMEDGTPVTEAARRSYGPMLRQLLRAAHWNFARREALLFLLGSSSGRTPAGAAISNAVDAPWQYAYAWPQDGVAARWMPWSFTPSTLTQTPISTAVAVSPQIPVRRPAARFLVTSSNAFPIETGTLGWGQLPSFAGTEGVGPAGRRVVLSNVANATLVYTRLVLSPEEWDPSFEETMVACMAERLALIAVTDRKLALSLRAAQIQIAKEQLAEARVRNANEAGFPQTLDHTPDWIRARRFGAARLGAGDAGWLYSGWEGCSFSDGSVF